MNTTPIEQCSLSADAEYTIKAATERGWSRFVIFPSGALLGTSPDGVEDEPVPNYGQTAKDQLLYNPTIAAIIGDGQDLHLTVNFRQDGCRQRYSHSFNVFFRSWHRVALYYSKNSCDKR